MGDFIFFPTLSGPMLVDYKNIPKQYLWWLEDCRHIYHPYLMISYGVFKIIGIEKSISRRKHLYLKDNDNVLIFADSGGLQMYTSGIYISPEEVLEWQSQIADWGLMLDHPVTRPQTYSEAEFDDYVKAAKKSRRSVEAVKNLVKKTDMKFWGILHGVNWDLLELWWDRVLEDFVDDLFYGIAFGVRPSSNLSLLVEMLHFLRKKGVKRVHALALGSPKAFILLGEASKYFNLVSCDTTNFSMAVGKGRAYYPTLLPGLTGVDVGFKSSINLIPCSCPACRELKKVRLGRSMSVHSYLLFHNHNLIVVTQMYNTVKAALMTGKLDVLAKLYGVEQYLNQIRKGSDEFIKPRKRWW